MDSYVEYLLWIYINCSNCRLPFSVQRLDLFTPKAQFYVREVLGEQVSKFILKAILQKIIIPKFH